MRNDRVGRENLARAGGCSWQSGSLKKKYRELLLFFSLCHVAR